MNKNTNKKISTGKTKAKTKNAKEFSLATCPVGNSGWCSFPFSPKQLSKRKPVKVEADKTLVASKA